jgi:hypothetical protein
MGQPIGVNGERFERFQHPAHDALARGDIASKPNDEFSRPTIAHELLQTPSSRKPLHAISKAILASRAISVKRGGKPRENNKENLRGDGDLSMRRQKKLAALAPDQ